MKRRIDIKLTKKQCERLKKDLVWNIREAIHAQPFPDMGIMTCTVMSDEASDKILRIVKKERKKYD